MGLVSLFDISGYIRDGAVLTCLYVFRYMCYKGIEYFLMIQPVTTHCHLAVQPSGGTVLSMLSIRRVKFLNLRYDLAWPKGSVADNMTIRPIDETSEPQ